MQENSKNAASGARAKDVSDSKEETAKIEAILRSIGDGIVATDETGHIVRINQTALSLLGREESEMIGQWYPKVISARSLEEEEVMITDRALLKALERGESVSEISQYQNKRGEYFPVAITASPILLNGKPTGCIEIFRDITKQKEAERSQREHSKEVERMNKFMVDREVKMSELKQEMERLRLENEDLKKLIVR